MERASLLTAFTHFTSLHFTSQLIRYAQCCSHYDNFTYRHKCLVDRLLSQGYIASRLEKSFKKFYSRYQDLIDQYQRSVDALTPTVLPVFVGMGRVLFKTNFLAVGTSLGHLSMKNNFRLELSSWP